MISVVIIDAVILSIVDRNKYKDIKRDLIILNNVLRLVSNSYLLVI